MAILWIILLATIGLALRAGLYGRRWNVADSDSRDGGGGPESMIDTCARTLILVLLSLMGLLVLGIMYGNVLGAVPARTEPGRASACKTTLRDPKSSELTSLEPN